MNKTTTTQRPRRLRQSPAIRNLVQEHHLHPHDLIQPLFVQNGTSQQTPVKSMPNIHRYSIDLLVDQVKQAQQAGIQAIALFPVTDPAKKDDTGSEALNPDNLICTAVKTIKDTIPDIAIICDVALDPYTTHGHDGIILNRDVDNDQTVDLLTQQALNQANAGCDIIAPSDMMDGRVGAIRTALDKEGFQSTLILSYAVKYASAFYGPFRDAVGSAQNLGKADKTTYQMNPANNTEALREITLDIQEGADILMVKPGMPYLDIIKCVKDNCHLPVFAYQVSGEYAMIHSQENANALMAESLIAFKRAGASGILTYAATNIAKEL